MLRKSPFFKSLCKPILFLGCERLPFTAIAGLGGVAIMAYQSIYTIIGVLVFWVVGFALIRRINNEDPQFFLCLFRYVKYFEDYYPANEFYPGRIEKSIGDANQ